MNGTGAVNRGTDVITTTDGAVSSVSGVIVAAEQCASQFMTESQAVPFGQSNMAPMLGSLRELVAPSLVISLNEAGARSATSASAKITCFTIAVNHYRAEGRGVATRCYARPEVQRKEEDPRTSGAVAH